MFSKEKEAGEWMGVCVPVQNIKRHQLLWEKDREMGRNLGPNELGSDSPFAQGRTTSASEDTLMDGVFLGKRPKLLGPHSLG